jgi:hypothetical protein
MEFAGRSRQTTAAADDVENGRRLRFPDLLPPQGNWITLSPMPLFLWMDVFLLYDMWISTKINTFVCVGLGSMIFSFFYFCFKLTVS